MKEKFKKLNRAIARNGFYITRAILSRLPYSVYRGCAIFFVAISRPLLIKKRKVAMNNLRIAFGKEYDEKKIKEIYRDCYKNFGQGMIDLIYLLDRPEEIERRVTINGQEYLDEVLQGGKGAILVSAHFGNFILMYLRMVQAGYKTNVIMRRVRDEKWEQYISDFRNERGIQTIYDLPPRRCVQGCIKALRNNEILFILLDQNYGGVGRIFVDFFGEQAATATGPVVLSNRTGAPILPIFIRHDGQERHQMNIEPPFQLQHCEDDQQTIVTNIAKITKIIEERIRERPHEWGGWMHNRWKSKTIEEQEKIDQLKEVPMGKT